MNINKRSEQRYNNNNNNSHPGDQRQCGNQVDSRYNSSTWDKYGECIVWYGMVWYGMVCYGMVWYGNFACVLCPIATVMIFASVSKFHFY